MLIGKIDHSKIGAYLSLRKSHTFPRWSNLSSRVFQFALHHRSYAWSYVVSTHMLHKSHDGLREPFSTSNHKHYQGHLQKLFLESTWLSLRVGYFLDTKICWLYPVLPSSLMMLNACWWETSPCWLICVVMYWSVYMILVCHVPMFVGSWSPGYVLSFPSCKCELFMFVD